ncbi:MAG: hypothetical protein IT300_14830, partial [Dehalococcoidia bacterium]|nr:hypothetical protein [Dehalococcoidia bacterium]
MRVRFHHSLAGRLVLFGVLPTLVLVGSLVVLGLLEKYRTLQTMVEQQLTSAAKLAAGRSEDRMNDAARTARILAEVVSAGDWEHPAEAVSVLGQVLERESVVSAIWLAIDGERLPAEGMSPELRALVCDGRFVPRVSRDPKRGGRPTLAACEALMRSEAV